MSGVVVSKEAMPKVPENRFWRVTHQPASRTTPVKVTLMERLPGVTRNSMAQAIAFENCIATPEAVIAAAELVDIRASRIDEVTGDY